MDPGRQVHREAQDAEQALNAQADGDAPGSAASDAPAAGRAAPLVRQRPAGPLRLLRCAAKLALPERVRARSPPHLVRLSPATEPAEPAHRLGLVRGCDRALPLPTPRITHPWTPRRGAMRVTLGKSRVRESRLPGSVRAEPNGRATRPLTRFSVWPITISRISRSFANRARAFDVNPHSPYRPRFLRAPTVDSTPFVSRGRRFAVDQGVQRRASLP